MTKKKNNFPPIKVTIKLLKEDGTTSTLTTKKTKRVYSKIKAEDFLETFIKVSYGRHIDVWDCLVEFDNFGTFQTKEETVLALQAFTEKSLLDDFEVTNGQ